MAFRSTQAIQGGFELQSKAKKREKGPELRCLGQFWITQIVGGGVRGIR